MIVLEGPDNAGKSMLASNLCRRMKKVKVHPGGPPKSDHERLLRMSEQLCSANSSLGKMTIYDRITCISDPIYRLDIDNALYAIFRRAMIDQNVRFVYCRPPYKILMNVQNHSIKEHDTAEQVELVKKNQSTFIELYDAMMRVEIPHIKFDYTVDDLDTLIRKLNEREVK